MYVCKVKMRGFLKSREGLFQLALGTTTIGREGCDLFLSVSIDSSGTVIDKIVTIIRLLYPDCSLKFRVYCEKTDSETDRHIKFYLFILVFIYIKITSIQLQ